MLVHGYSSERPGIVITHIISSDGNIIKEMANHSFRYDSECNDYLASFIHFTVKERDEFVDEFNIILVDDKKELEMLKKIISGT